MFVAVRCLLLQELEAVVAEQTDVFPSSPDESIPNVRTWTDKDGKLNLPSSRCEAETLPGTPTASGGSYCSRWGSGRPGRKFIVCRGPELESSQW